MIIRRDFDTGDFALGEPKPGEEVIENVTNTTYFPIFNKIYFQQFPTVHDLVATFRKKPMKLVSGRRGSHRRNSTVLTNYPEKMALHI